MGLAGSGVGIANFRLRFLMLIFIGLVGFGAIMYWRNATLQSADYVEIPTRTKFSNPDSLRSKNYQIEVSDTSPSAN